MRSVSDRLHTCIFSKHIHRRRRPMDNVKKREIRIPDYSLGEELFNAISHGIGALLGAAALVLMVVKAHGALPEVTVSVFGVTMIQLYSISCIYHAIPPSLKGLSSPVILTRTARKITTVRFQQTGQILFSIIC